MRFDMPRMPPDMDRSRSRSPYRSTESPRKRKRSRSPRRHLSEHKSRASAPIPLPFQAHPLTRHDLTTYRPMFALYLDIQKQKDIEELPEDEVKGRWKSFTGKWNRGELTEGWYDPKILQKAQDAENGREAVPKQKSSLNYQSKPPRSGARSSEGSDNEDEFGPSLPANLIQSAGPNGERAGPTIPRIDDLQIQKELLSESLSMERRQELEDLRAARRADRKIQSARLDELVPRAEPGTRERQLEKKREAAASNKAFASSKEPGGDVELPDAEVMGGGDSLEELKRMKQANERKKTEREVRREEVLRAKQAEREERVRGMKEKEEKTMAMLQEIAKARFGTGNEHRATLEH